MKKIILILLGTSALLAVGFNLSGCKNDKKKKCPGAETGCCTNQGACKTLSTHNTKAIYKGQQQMDDNSGTLAIFDIVAYNDYAPASEYADPQADECNFMLDPDDAMDAAAADMIDSLQPGDTVTLVWDQVYATDPQTQVSFPKRIIRKIEHLFQHDKNKDAKMPVN